MKKIDWRDTAVRAAKTAAQAFLGILTFDAFLGAEGVSVLRDAAMAGLAAAFAILHNAALEWSRS